MECANCKKLGHSFRDCKEPTTSYGIVAIRRDSPTDTPRYLLIRRRDSLGYVDFVRGKYTLENTTYIQTLLGQMTRDEQQRLLVTPFDSLWSQLWNGQNTRQFRNEYEFARRMFETLKNTGDIHGRLLAQHIEKLQPTWSEPEWGFPKGRRAVHESEIACAQREFSEETGLAATDIRVRTDESAELEEYVGSNGVKYRHIYYIADCRSDVRLDKANRVQTREVGDIGWFSFDEAYLRIRSTNPEKRAALGRIHARILGL